MRMAKAFTQFEAKPVASASLGQVHIARLRDGRAVAVKVQRPDIREALVDDLQVSGRVFLLSQIDRSIITREPERDVHRPGVEAVQHALDRVSEGPLPGLEALRRMTVVNHDPSSSSQKPAAQPPHEKVIAESELLHRHRQIVL